MTTILASGIGLATSQYTKSMSNSEAQILYSSLQKIMDTELRFTKTILVESDQDRMAVREFFSKHYVPDGSGASGLRDTYMLCTVAGGTGNTGAQNPSTPGQLGMATKIGPDAVVSTFLGEGAYNYGLQAFVNSIAYVKSGRYFVVDLAITQNSDVDNPLARGVFTVHALNLTSARDESGTEIDLKRDPENNNSGTGGGTGTGEGSGSGTTTPSNPSTVVIGNTPESKKTYVVTTLPDDPPTADNPLTIYPGCVYSYGGRTFVALAKTTFPGDTEYVDPSTVAGNNGDKLYVELPANPTIVNSYQGAGMGSIYMDSDGNYYICEKHNSGNNLVNWQILIQNPSTP
ncbi:MAG: hypothetical protein ACI4OC_00140 [Coriobacteriales bacterium]